MFELILKDKEMHHNIQDWLKIFKSSPSIEFANLIVENLVIYFIIFFILTLIKKKQTKEHYSVPIDQIVSILLDSDQPENGLKFLKDQIIKISKGFYSMKKKNFNLTKIFR